MISRRIARFEKLILKPLSLLFLILSVIYFFQRGWLICAFFLLAWVCIGVIGQSLHKDKSFAELARGGLDSEENIAPNSEMSHAESYALAKPLLLTSWLCGIATIVMLFHGGYGWFMALPAGLVVTILTAVISALVAVKQR